MLLLPTVTVGTTVTVVSLLNFSTTLTQGGSLLVVKKLLKLCLIYHLVCALHLMSATFGKMNFFEQFRYFKNLWKKKWLTFH